MNFKKKIIYSNLASKNTSNSVLIFIKMIKKREFLDVRK